MLYPKMQSYRVVEPMESPSPIIGVVLAGGRAHRLGGVDKGLVELHGRPLIEWVIEHLAPQVDTLLINANRNHERYARYGYTVIPDDFGDFAGPLAGFAAAMARAKQGALVTVPCDAPNPPRDLAERLASSLTEKKADLAVAHDGESLQPVHALLPVALLSDLMAFLEAGNRKTRHWYARHSSAIVDFSDCPQAFHNLNRPEDLARIVENLTT